jgi:hypothetical protein
VTTHHQLRGATSVDDWKMTPSFETINFQDDRIAWLAVNVNLWRSTWRPAWSSLAWFVTWLLTRRRAGIEDLVWRLAVKSRVRTVFVVPIHDQRRLLD